MKNEKVLPTIEQMKQDNENYKLNLLRHFEGADINLIIEAILESKGLQLSKLSDIQNEIVFDFITKKELLNPKNKISYIKAIEELNIYYVAATRAKEVIQLADLNLSYTYNENDETTSYVKSRFTNKQTHNKKV